MQKQRLKPTEYDIDVCYKCPSCDWNNWLRPQHFQNSKFILFCECGESYMIEPPDFSPFIKIKNIKPKLKTPSIKTAYSKKQSNIKKDNKDIVFELLESSGFEVAKIKKALQNVPNNSITEMMKQTIIKI